MCTDDVFSYAIQAGHGLPHDPIPAILGPRPIGWISTRDAEGRLNLAPYSFFNIFNYKPPLVAFSSVGKKDSVRNAEATGEFVYNLATRPLAEQVNQTSIDAPPGVDEFALTGLTPARCIEVAAPRVAQSPVSLECKVTQVQQLAGIDGVALNTWMVFGEVVAVHIDRALLRDGIYDTAAAQPILRAGGPADYFEVLPQGRFRMYRPR
ncbi:flavin reductase family protein [Ralstonia solanacearum]|uniref:flavin reductase family protein n=1 Tax=Ralstonia solanacearum TaxID=305 RepID=UPI00078DF8D9|nr:flavin reductase family protein [Ralstonia solanacearum]AMP37658.1 Asp/Glu/hydantoin racemase [Ralstonia solanacearum]AXV86483.1 flavin reductase family protein [Ralstonia solanacearum]AXW05985.1 flavin reductase family protein [Ralstonia solanacearum]AXW23729.1 flavin reductase family protein [Ralstonia solanacearum]AXW80661.1 flavin reductase family protein [Ralstonia solanacearum]